MKKQYLKIIVVVCFIGIMLNFNAIAECISKNFWNIVCNQLEKEEIEREKRIANGEIVRGKDTVLIWENKYVIYHVNDSKCLTIETNDVSADFLRDVKKHVVKKRKLFVVADEGYAVIDEDGFCRVYLVARDDDAENQHCLSEMVQCSEIEYLSSYDDFDESEKEILDKMLTKIES